MKRRKKKANTEFEFCENDRTWTRVCLWNTRRYVWHSDPTRKLQNSMYEKERFRNNERPRMKHNRIWQKLNTAVMCIDVHQAYIYTARHAYARSVFRWRRLYTGNNIHSRGPDMCRHFGTGNWCTRSHLQCQDVCMFCLFVCLTYRFIHGSIHTTHGTCHSAMNLNYQIKLSICTLHIKSVQK